MEHLSDIWVGKKGWARTESGQNLSSVPVPPPTHAKLAYVGMKENQGPNITLIRVWFSVCSCERGT